MVLSVNQMIGIRQFNAIKTIRPVLKGKYMAGLLFGIYF
jgi:hypothetical protein